MSETVLKIENLSKLYRLGEVGTGTISHDLNRWFAKVRGKEDPFAKVGQVNHRSKQATVIMYGLLKDIGFEVKKGEVLGIIGKEWCRKINIIKINIPNYRSNYGFYKGKRAGCFLIGGGYRHASLK